MAESVSRLSRAAPLRRWLTAHARAVALGVIVLGLVVRVWLVLAASPLNLHGDEISYWNRAAAILATGDPGTAIQPPGMSYVLALVRWWSPEGLTLARGLNVVWYAVGALALVVLARDWQRALVPLGVYALHPVLIGFTGFLWTEPLFVALLLAAFALAVAGGRCRAALAGAVFALATLTRQIGLPLFALALARSLYEAGWSRTRLVRVGVMAVAFALVVSPWVARNWIVLGEPVFTTNSGFGLWVGNENEFGPAYAWQYLRHGRYAAYYMRMGSDELSRDKEARRRAVAFIAAEMPAWLYKKPAVGLAHLFEPDNFVLRRVRLGHYGVDALPWLPLIGVVTLGGELLVLVWGVYVTFALRDRAAQLMLLAMMLGNTAIQVVTVGHARHRLVLGLLPLVVTGVQRKPFAAARLAAALLLVGILVSFGVFSPGRQQLVRTFAGDGQIEQRPTSMLP